MPLKVTQDHALVRLGMHDFLLAIPSIYGLPYLVLFTRQSTTLVANQKFKYATCINSSIVGVTTGIR